MEWKIKTLERDGEKEGGERVGEEREGDGGERLDYCALPCSVGQADLRFGFLRFCRCKKWCHMPRLDHRHQRYKGGLKMGLSAHCRVLLCNPISDLDS